MPANKRFNAQRDAAEPEIVDALKSVGCMVYRELPCDLLVRLHGDPPGVLRTMEVKTPTPTGKRRKRRDQTAQDAFLAETGTPVVLTPAEAVEVVNRARWGMR